MELVFIIDTSGSMYGSRIAAVNHALTECLSSIRRHIRSYDMDVKVRFMTFDDRPTLMLPVEDIMNSGFPVFSVSPDNDFYRLTRFEALYDMIIAESKGWEKQDTGMILITDGKAIDSGGYKEKLEKAKSLDFFRNGKSFVDFLSFFFNFG